MGNAIPNENSSSILATVASYVGIDRQESAAGAISKQYAVTQDAAIYDKSRHTVRLCAPELGLRHRDGWLKRSR